MTEPRTILKPTCPKNKACLYKLSDPKTRGNELRDNRHAEFQSQTAIRGRSTINK